MNGPRMSCLDERRRHKVRGEDLNGLDFLEVSDDQLTLRVCFLGKAPEGLRKENIRIKGGRRIRGEDINIVDIEIHRRKDPDLDDCMEVVVDRHGDFSIYSLCVVRLDESGQPTDEPFPGFDPRYACLEFSFKAGCPTNLDCKPHEVCPPAEWAEPNINYLAKDYSSFRRLILDRLALITPDWQERHVPDIGIALVEILAYVGDHLSYFQDAVATEAYLDTARQRISVRRHARLVDYPMHEGCNARAWVHVETSSDHPLSPRDTYFITRLEDVSFPEGQVLTEEDLGGILRATYEVFEPLIGNADAPIQLYKAHNEIHLYTWGDRECCLPRGATSATLKDECLYTVPAEKEESSGTASEQESDKWATTSGGYEQTGPEQELTKEPPPPAPGLPGRDRVLQLRKGDVLIFEEVLGPKTGNSADADPSRRQAVRLTRVEPSVDSLYEQPVLEIEWALEDALRFPLCISTIGPPPECALLEGISVARGNVILVDHGRRVDDEDLGDVPAESTKAECRKEGEPSETEVVPGRFRPRLRNGPLTFREPLPPRAPASRSLIQDPRLALPQIKLSSVPPPKGCEEPKWTPRRDLLDSRSRDCHFAVEVDGEGRAHLRFGDGELGWMPEAGMAFRASYRVGIGPAGNVGAETISHVVLRGAKLSGVDLQPRNPMPAQGGTPPEPLADVKLFAPHAFRTELKRAVTPADYARLAERHPVVQHAAATLRWTGSWYEVLVAIDPAGQEQAEPSLLREVHQLLYPYRRMGHDLAVEAARYAPLYLELIVCVLPDYLRAHVESELRGVFSNRVLPDGRRGYFHPDELTFGEGIYLSEIVATAQRVPGVEAVFVEKLHRLHEETDEPKLSGFLKLGPLEIARLDNDPSFPENGELKFDMRGGR